ncbi:MAG: hypothetical protein WCW68_00480 [Methanothrix sp.]
MTGNIDYGDGYKKMLNRYIKSFNCLMRDAENSQVAERVFSVDFSEIYSYMFYRRSTKDYKLLEIVFSRKKDCNLVLTPPAIYELIKYYQTIEKLPCKYINSYREVLSLPQVENFMINYNNYRRAKNENIADNKIDKELYKKVNESYLELVRFGNPYEQRIGGLSFLFGISAPNGYKRLCESHDKLISLLENNIIISLDRAVEYPEKISEVSIDPHIYDIVLNYLKHNRPKTYINNIVDAELAALSAGFNKVFEKDRTVMNVLTGSKYPLIVLEQIQQKNRLDLVRDPFYCFTRFSLHDITGGDYIEMRNMSLNCINILNDLDMYADISRDAKNISTALMQSSLKSSHDFLYLMFYDQNLMDDLANAIVSQDFNDEIRELISIKLNKPKIDREDDTSMERELEMIANTIRNPDEAIENLMRVNDDIKKILKEVYIFTYKYMLDYDFSMLSPSMYSLNKVILNDRGDINEY